jgi:hypothetical protein
MPKKKIDSNPQGKQPDPILIPMPGTPEKKQEWLEKYVYSKIPPSIDAKRPAYSATIDLYDAIPKFVYGARKTIEKIANKRIAFEHHKIKYFVELVPAQIEDNEITGEDAGSYIPGESEELIEDALRKLALEGHGTMSKTAIVGVRFKMYELFKILRDCGVARKYSQIYKSLLIMSRTNITLTCSMAGNRMMMVCNIIPFMRIMTRDNAPPDEDTICDVTFHPLVTRSFSLNTQRLFNIEKFFSYKHNVSRRLHKKISHNFSTANAINKHYHITMSSIVNEFNIVSRRWPKETYSRNILPALLELKEKNVIEKYSYENIIREIDGEEKEDFLIKLTLTEQTINEIITANVYSGKTMVKDTSDMPSPVPFPLQLFLNKTTG